MIVRVRIEPLVIWTRDTHQHWLATLNARVPKQTRDRIPTWADVQVGISAHLTPTARADHDATLRGFLKILVRFGKVVAPHSFLHIHHVLVHYDSPGCVWGTLTLKEGPNP